MNIAVQYVPVLVAAVLTIPLGAMWYNHSFFGKPWMAMNKITPQMMKKGPGGIAYAASIVSAVVTAATLWLFIGIMGSKSLPVNLGLAILLWIAFNFLPGLMHHLFAKKPVPLLLINSAFDLVNMLVIATVLTIYW